MEKIYVFLFYLAGLSSSLSINTMKMDYFEIIVPDLKGNTVSTTATTTTATTTEDTTTEDTTTEDTTTEDTITEDTTTEDTTMDPRIGNAVNRTLSFVNKVI